MITVVSDLSHPLFLTDAGKHAKLGELIARCVKEATRDALARQTGLGAESQQNMLVRLERFGIGEEDFWEAATSLPGENNREEFLAHLRKMAEDPVLVAATASLLHIVDEIGWGLLPGDAGKKAADSMMAGFFAAPGMERPVDPGSFFTGNDMITKDWVCYVASWIKNFK